MIMSQFKIDPNKKYVIVKGQRGGGKRLFDLQLLQKYYDEGYPIVVLRKEDFKNENDN